MNHMTTLDSDPMRILIVDDSAASRDLLYALLTAAGYADVIAVDGDPVQDIRAMSRVDFVMRSGQTYKAPAGALIPAEAAFAFAG